MKKIFLYALVLCSVLLFSCKPEKEQASPQTGSLDFYFTHTVDSQGLQIGQYDYYTAANNRYKVTALRYFISKLTLYKENGESYDADMYHYVSLAQASTHTYTLSGIPNGVYTRMSFVFGIDSARNHMGGIPATNETLSMIWPDAGYHFMQLDGFYKNTENADKVFNIHLGMTPNQVVCSFDNLHLEVSGNTQTTGINMNVNKWFDGANRIDLNDDYSAIMEDPAKQLLFRQNVSAVFTVEAPHHH